MKKLIFIATSLFTAAVSNAGCTPDHCGGVYIEKLYVQASGTIYVGTDGDESKLTCNAVSDVYVTIDANSPGKDAIYSTLLAAQLAGKRIETIQVNDKLPGCIVQYITLNKQ